MYLDTKNYLKCNRYHTAKHPLIRSVLNKKTQMSQLDFTNLKSYLIK
jgi:hypothetical protein